MSADLLGLFEAHGLKPKKKTAKEWGAACPACGGTDRCMVRPEDHDGRGGYHCRQCQTYGDAIQFLRDFEGLSFKDACERVGIQASRATASLPKAPRKAPGREPFEAAESIPPAERWTRKATGFAAWAHEHLLNTPEQLSWLAARGLPLEAVKRYRLGWNPGERGKSCLIRPRSVWGLPLPEARLDADGNPQRPKTTFWIPRGLVIPMLGPDGSVLRLRIRRPEADRASFKEETKYYVIPGGCMDAMVLGADSRAFVVVESELDALMLHHQAGDLAGAVSVMTSTVKKIEASALEALSRALCVLVALDCDTAGAKGWERWSVSLPRAKRWPCPVGKDPGEAFAAGANLRAWILAGLPPVLQPGLLPAGRPDLGGAGERAQGAASVLEVPQSAPAAAPSTVQAASSPLPAWLHQLSEPDLEMFGEARAPLLELAAFLRGRRVGPVLLPGRNGDRALVLWAADGLRNADPAAFDRARDLFFGDCLEAVLYLIDAERLKSVTRLKGCHGHRDHDGEWAMLVRIDGGLSCAGWRRLDHWFV
ncbi:DNA primase [Fundidesulfovibrio magnetotacticus]|uniref:DNA primase n=1 Tax=Fundidesulfovibrio magnetotacticus TaxID=2730080 RepID=A0A6V8LZ05_9BACT|nr:CHC2 zinc finger domain-containing protein [Fundidesulfovibrio magnetotacticus]GFK95468.1 DNA primase [Fundidesulfovibrio magnetotacticus]